jgi:hypothetical protein
MKKLLFLGILFASLTAWSQEPFSGKIIDKTTKKPVAFAGLKFKFSRLQMMANADGRFSIPVELSGKNDSVTISCVGYKSRTLTLRKLESSATTELEPFMYSLNTVDVKDRGNIDFPYQLFDRIAQKYRKSSSLQQSKGYFYFMSRMDDLPLELVEEYFSGESSCEDGIVKLTLKTGRLGYCLSNFYSLSTTDILTHFTLFSLAGNGNMPFSPGNYNFRRLKKFYDMQITGVSSEKPAEKLILSFRPNQDTSELFSGYAWINRHDETIEKIEYRISTNDFFFLKPAIEGDKTDSITLSLVYVLDNTEPAKPRISRVSLEYSLRYSSKRLDNTIPVASEGTLVLYDPKEPFPGTLPADLFSEMSNDYQRIACLPYDSLFWESGHITLQSEKQKQFAEYFEANGVLVNFSKSLDSIAGSNFIHWNGEKNLRMADLPNHPPASRQTNNGTVIISNGTTHSNKPIPNYYSIDSRIIVNPVFLGDTLHVASSSVLDKWTTYYFAGKGPKADLFLNLEFDLCEIQRRVMMQRFRHAAAQKRLTFETIRTIYGEETAKLKSTLQDFHKGTMHGTDAPGLMKWEEKIAKETGVSRRGLAEEVERGIKKVK